MNLPYYITIVNWQKSKREFYNNFRIFVCWPRCQIGKLEAVEPFYLEEERKWGIEINFNTEIVWNFSQFGWMIGIKILGFGIIVNRQITY